MKPFIKGDTLNLYIQLKVIHNLKDRQGCLMKNSEALPQTFDLVIKNVHLLTMDKKTHHQAYGLINDAAIAVLNGEISWLGQATDLPDIPCKNVVDGQGQFLSPGLIDCHTHLVFAGSRADEFEKRLNGMSYKEIAEQGGGILSTVNATREASFDELLALAETRVNTLMKEGVTCIEIKSGYGLNTETEIKMLKVAQALEQSFPVEIRRTFLGAHAVPPEFKNDPDGYIDYLITDTLPALVEQDLVDAVDGFCENIGFSTEQIKKLFDAAKKYNLPVKLHAEQLSDSGGTGLVIDMEGLSADHVEYLSEKDCIKLSHSVTIPVLLPGAFHSLSETQLPPIKILRELNVPMAIGSDYNPGSSPLCSLKLMLSLACTHFKLTPEESLLGVTCNAAKALGLDKVGALKVGYRADFCLWDIKHPAELSYTFGINPLTRMWIRGQTCFL